MVIGLILGPLAETQVLRALAIGLGDPLVLLQSRIAETLLALAAIALVAPFALGALRRLRSRED